jgi:hypothetical protein
LVATTKPKLSVGTRGSIAIIGDLVDAFVQEGATWPFLSVRRISLSSGFVHEQLTIDHASVGCLPFRSGSSLRVLGRRFPHLRISGPRGVNRIDSAACLFGPRPHCISQLLAPTASVPPGDRLDPCPARPVAARLGGRVE